MARSKTLWASVDRIYHSENATRGDFQILLNRLNEEARKHDVDLIMWDTMVLSTEVNEVDDRVLVGPTSTEEYLIWTAKVTGVIVDD